MTHQQILAETESGEAPLKKRKVVHNEEPKDPEGVLRKKKLALRAQKLIDAMKSTQVPVNMEMAEEFDEETKKMVEGKLDDVEFFEQLLLGVACTGVCNDFPKCRKSTVPFKVVLV